jgi:hypothetical protein
MGKMVGAGAGAGAGAEIFEQAEAGAAQKWAGSATLSRSNSPCSNPESQL